MQKVHNCYTISSMNSDINAVKDYFAKLDLEPEIAQMYISLHTYGPQSLSELARRSGVERTRIYRLMDTLKSSSLIETEQQYKRTILHAAPLTNLEVLISKKEQEVKELHSELHALHQSLGQASNDSALTKVQYYQGSEGVKQMLWNQTKSSSENLSVLYENIQMRTKLAYFERWVQTCNTKGLSFRGIIGDNFIKSQQAWYGSNANERLQRWEARYIAPELYAITHSMVLYDDIIAYYNWKDGEVFGIEIRNHEIAAAQRQLFEIIWNQAQPVDDLRGPA